MAGTSKMPEFTDDSDLDSDQSFSTALPGSPPVLRRNIGYAQAPAEDEYVVNLDDPELLCTTPTTTRKITARPGQAGDRLDFRGYIVTTTIRPRQESTQPGISRRSGTIARTSWQQWPP